MKTIKIINEEDRYYHDDCKRICSIMKEHGYICSIKEAKELWEKFSEGMAAGWMNLDEDDATVFACIEYYFEEDGEIEIEDEWLRVYNICL